MLLTQCMHPEILEAVGMMGHGSKILISDGGYPHLTATPQTAKKVWLNLRPGMLLVTDVLEVLSTVIPIEEAWVMTPPDGTEQPVYDEFRKRLPEDLELQKISQFDFYPAARDPDIGLVIATGDQRNYSNLMLKMGFVKHPGGQGDY